MTDDQIKHMVNRFLAWRLPENFRPDCGISFTPTYNDHTPHPMKREPVGTNLFDVTQAEAMVRHMVEGLATQPAPSKDVGVEEGRKLVADARNLLSESLLAPTTLIGRMADWIEAALATPESEWNAAVEKCAGLVRSYGCEIFPDQLSDEVHKLADELERALKRPAPAAEVQA